MMPKVPVGDDAQPEDAPPAARRDRRSDRDRSRHQRADGQGRLARFRFIMERRKTRRNWTSRDSCIRDSGFVISCISGPGCLREPHWRPIR
jgi:hypothetical protein